MRSMISELSLTRADLYSTSWNSSDPLIILTDECDVNFFPK